MPYKKIVVGLVFAAIAMASSPADAADDPSALTPEAATATLVNLVDHRLDIRTTVTGSLELLTNLFSTDFLIDQIAADVDIVGRLVTDLLGLGAHLANGQVAVSNVALHALDDDHVEVTSDETATFDYVGDSSPDAPQSMGEKYTRTSTFEQIEGSWRLTSSHTNGLAVPEIEPLSTFQPSPSPPDESAPEPVNEDVSQTPDSDSDSDSASMQPAAFIVSAIENNSYSASRTKYVNYMDTYWDNYNSDKYRSFSGEDCTNFVSQAEYYAGFPKEDTGGSETSLNSWWYKQISLAPDKWSSTWINTGKHYSWLRNSSRASVYSAASSLSKGDEIMADWETDGVWDHLMGVTAKDSSNRVYLTYHTNDVHNKRFDRIYDTHTGETYKRLHLDYSK